MDHPSVRGKRPEEKCGPFVLIRRGWRALLLTLLRRVVRRRLLDHLGGLRFRLQRLLDRPRVRWAGWNRRLRRVRLSAGLLRLLRVRLRGSRLLHRERLRWRLLRLGGRLLCRERLRTRRLPLLV